MTGVRGFAGLRAVALGGVAVLGTAIALAVSHHRDRSPAAVSPAGEWFTAMAGSTASTKSKKGACGVVVGPATPGIVHPVLPCGVKIFVELHGREVLTQVVDHGQTAPGRTFVVTRPVAKLLGLQGIQAVRWRFAQ